MSEEILRILLSDLSTIRIKLKNDGVVRELPLDQLHTFATKAEKSRDILPATRDSLSKIWEGISDLLRDDCDIEVEFVIPVKK